MKLTIENKILIPFVLLFFISLTVLLATSFRNDYHFIVENQFRYMDEKMNELERNLNYGIYEEGIIALTEEEVIHKINSIIVSDIIVLKNEKIILNNTSPLLSLRDLNIGNSSTNTIQHVKGDYLISYKDYQPFAWTLIILEEKKELLAFFYNSYKYNFLTGIIFLTISLQLTILIASNITKPIQKLVRFCTLIAEGEYGERIIFRRQDEIGQLGLAFNRMLDQLNASMNELISVKNFNQDILNNIEKGIITFDSDEVIISDNPFANQIINEFEGYTHEEKVLLHIAEQMVSMTQNEKTSINMVFEFIRCSDGDTKILDFYTSIMWGENSEIRGYICSFNDITERRKIESRMQRLDRLATAGRLASGVAHEIRNPLTGMRTSIQVLNKRLKSVLSGSNAIMFERLIKEIDRMNKLISDLLDYSKRSDNLPEKVSLYHRVSDTLGLLDSELKNRGILVEIDCDNKAIEFFMDPSHLNQILLNIIKNAMDAVEVNKGIIRIIGRYTDESSTKAELMICDNGSGIPQTLLEKVFDPFFTTKLDGTGLGLSVVHELIQQNNGEIDIHSRNNEGTQIILRFKTGGVANE